MSEHYACPACGLHYKDKEWAAACEDFCNQNQACSLEIANHSTEAEATKAP